VDLQVCDFTITGTLSRDQIRFTLSVCVCVCVCVCVVPPEQPEIVGYQNGSLVRVSDKLVSLNLTCRSRAAKPAATLTWLRNGVELSPDDGQATYSTAESTDAGSSGGKLQDAESVLTFVPSDDDNEAHYTCAAQNEALQRPLSVTVQLSVLREFSLCL